MSCDYLTREVFKYLKYKLFPCDEKMRDIKHASKETNNLLLKITDFFSEVLVCRLLAVTNNHFNHE